MTTAQIFVGIELRNGDKERRELLRRFGEKGYSIVDMTDNETAKLHIRYMVGGHAKGVRHENLVRFEFPERPGALQYFLSGLGKRWNISLFHYRNHGAAYGRVLMGYRYWDESDNPAYQLFAGTEQVDSVTIS